MSDPIAQAAAQLDAAPSSTEPVVATDVGDTAALAAADAARAEGFATRDEVASISPELAAAMIPAPSSTEPQQPAPEVVLNPGESATVTLTGPDAGTVAKEAGTSAPGEPVAETISSAVTSSEPSAANSLTKSTENSASSESPNGATPAAGEPVPASTGEHPHTSILRRMTETLRRKWNVFDGELEAILKDAESHL